MLYARIARAALAAGALFSASFSSFGQVGTSAEFEEILVKTFTSFAGSAENAQSLVSGLRGGTQLTLQPAVPGCAPPPPPPVLPPFPGGMPGGLPGGLPGFPPPPPPAPAPVLPASFTPPTGIMGYGNVNTAIDLAQQQLAKAGITKPTPVQIRASFMGGQVSTCAGVSTQLEGILVLRAGKEGWGRIAARLGL